MKHLTIRRLKTESKDIQYIADELKKIKNESIDCLNWEEQYPSKPNVTIRAAHSSDMLYLQYEVHEKELLGLVNEDNGRVWTDSCVEFFVSFDEGDHYYNLEFNCIGKALVGYRKMGDKGIYAPSDVMQNIQRLPSLGTHTIDSTQGNFLWTLTLIIPVSTFWMSGLSSFDGLKARANFYKCGDNLSVPHFISWSPIENDKPNFHLTTFFGQVDFE